MKNKKHYDISIFSHNLSLVSEKSEKEIKEYCSYIEEKIQMLANKRNHSHIDLFAMACIILSDEVFRLKESSIDENIKFKKLEEKYSVSLGEIINLESKLRKAETELRNLKKTSTKTPDTKEKKESAKTQSTKQQTDSKKYSKPAESITRVLKEAKETIDEIDRELENKAKK